MDNRINPLIYFFILIIMIKVKFVSGYDPDDKEISSVVTPNGTFEAFYAKDPGTGSARAAHSHGSFFKYRNPALVDTKNAAAYGYRFDGKRRFNYE
ncbi:uncharacterized protein LOC123319546 [Coccinella septempunctata]|uniref:uncharacterized protein LOC123319546 n=1 Tax=Coccinella septempunctata TaxID=41139 RepID=UPI001D061593|nr:uncharacterized protein LOC123319546 [Coccinella septempunctata]